MTLSLQNTTQRTVVQMGVTVLVVYIVYRLVTGFFGPVPLRVNVSNADIDNIVVKFKVKGIVTPFSGGHASVTRIILHEEVKLIKANELTEFSRAYMWMALDPVEYAIEVYHPALHTEYKVVKLADLEDSHNLPVMEVNALIISDMIDRAKQKYDSATSQQKERIKSHSEDAYHNTI